MNDRKRPVAGYVLKTDGTVIRNFSLAVPSPDDLASMIEVIAIRKELGREPKIMGNKGTELSYLGPVGNGGVLHVYSTTCDMTHERFETIVEKLKKIYTR